MVTRLDGHGESGKMHTYFRYYTHSLRYSDQHLDHQAALI